MSDYSLKYLLLNKLAKQEVNDFIDFLFSKQKKNRKKPIDSYKKKILKVSVWSEQDMKIFDENIAFFNRWNVQEW